MLRYERILYSVPARCGLSVDDCADVAQTVCVRLIENLDKLRDEGHLTGWLITTLRREAWRVARERNRQVDFSNATEREDVDGLLASIASAGPQPHEETIRLEEEILIAEALLEMDDRCRRLIELLYQTDPVPTYDEIADRMQMPRGALGPTRGRCMQRLRKILQRLDF